MASVEKTQKLANELIEILAAKNVDPDDAVPAFIVVGVKLAIARKGADDFLLDTLLKLVRAAFTDEQNKRKEQQQRRH